MKRYPSEKLFFAYAIILIVCFALPVRAQQDTISLKEVEIRDEAVILAPVEVIKLELPGGEPVRDIGDYMRSVPNISGIRKGGIAIDPVVRGFKYSQVSVILNDGIKIEGGCPNRMDPVASHVEPENLTSVEMVKGPYLLKYGPAFGALIILKTIQPAPVMGRPVSALGIYGFETNWNGQREHVAVRGGGKRLYASAGGGFKGYGSYTAGHGEQFNTSFQKLYLSVDAGAALTKTLGLRASYFYDNGRNVLFPALPMDEVSDNTHVASLSLKGTPGQKTLRSYSVLGYFSSVHHVMDNHLRPTFSTMEATTTVEAFNAGGKAETILGFGMNQLTVGADFEHIYKDGTKDMTMYMTMDSVTYKSTKKVNVFNRAQWNNAGAFAEFLWPMGNLKVIIAGRLDVNQATSCDTFELVKEGVTWFGDPNSLFFNVSFSAGVSYDFAWHWSVRAALGRGTRSPSLLERFIKLMPVQYDSYDYLGNPALKPEKNHQADVALSYEHPAIGKFSIDGFAAIVNDYITGKYLPPSVIKPSTQGAPGVKQFSNMDWVYLTGFEFSYYSPAEKLWGVFATCGYTAGTAPCDTMYIVKNGQVTGKEEIQNDPLAEIPPLEGTIGISYKFWKNRIIPRLSVRMVNSQKRVSKAYYEETTPGFVVANFGLTINPFPFISLSAGVDNLFNASYYEHLNRRIVGSADRLMEPGRVYYVSVSVKI